MGKIRSALIILVLFGGGVFTGCSEDKPARVVEQSDDGPAGIVESGPAAPEEETPIEDVTEEASETAVPATAGIGDTVEVGDWQVKVTKVQLDAAEVIHKANQFNDRPKGNYVLVTYEGTYIGSERSADVWADLTWTFTTTDSQVHETSSQVTPFENQELPTEARAGGTVQHQVVFDLDPKLIQGGTLTVEGYDENYDTVYADFTF